MGGRVRTNFGDVAFAAFEMPFAIYHRLVRFYGLRERQLLFFGVGVLICNFFYVASFSLYFL